MPWVPLVIAGSKMISANKQRRAAQRNADRAFEYQKEKDALLEEQKQAYRDIKFTNPYKNMENAFEGLQTSFTNLADSATNKFAGGKNVYEGMENRFEDATVDMQAANFQAEQGQQQRANILQGLRGAAGSSGVSSLAQTLANAGSLQSQQISAGISQQERQNKMMAAQEGSRIDMAQRGASAQLQQMEMSGAANLQAMQLDGASQARSLGIGRQNLIAQGAGAADMAERGGEAMLQEAEMSRQSTLLGVAFGEASGANEGYQQSLTNQQYANNSAQQMQNDSLSTFAEFDYSSLS